MNILENETIQRINAALVSDEYANFPAVRFRLVEIRTKIVKNKELSKNDIATLEYNNLLNAITH